ncbi:ABC transporter substrate-binding protein [Nesterenkonia sp. K-15-9-6]|uniref:ABC transporter substrate-binding protein n=1 Tax=Nesterenkonia sp. K-15-9-6 TaxID=3093918 RepID=UPI0040446377
MKIRKLSAAVAMTAAGALVLSGCTPGADENGNGNGEDEVTNGADADPGEAEGQQYTVDPTDGSKAELPDDWATADDEIRVSMGPDEFMSYNGLTPATYNVYNSTIVARLIDSFWYYGTDLSINRNEDFGTFDVVNEDPFTVEYTINDDVTWSDGTPVTAADYIFDWATNAYAGEAGFDPVSTTLADYVTQVPEGDWDGKTFTLEFDEVYADWELLVSTALPAHIVADQIGVSLEELIEAVRDEDMDVLEEAAEFWNEGWNEDPGTLPDEELIPSSGPFKLADWSAGEYVTLEANEDYWGTPPGVERLVYQFVDNAQHVQALENGDLHVARPAETVDTRQELERLAEAGTHVLHSGDVATWEHLDFQYGEGSAFGENPELAEAFALCIPREQIVENLIKPVNEDAEVLNAREVLAFEDDYDDYVADTYDGQYDEVDLDRAQQIMDEHGAEDVQIRIGHNAQERRHDTVELIQASCGEVGFDVVDEGDVDIVIAEGDWDVALFAWAGSGQVASGRNIYSFDVDSDEPFPQNWNNFQSEEVNEAWDRVAATTEWDEERWEALKDVERGLWEGLHGMPLYVHPGLSGSDATIQNVRHTAAQTQLVWNAEQWQRSE